MKRFLILSASVAVLVNPCNARDWSFDDCVNYAREHNITLQQSKLNEQLSEQSLEESKAQWQPTLDFATTHTFTNHPAADGTKNSYNSNYGLNAGWTVWNGGARENSIKRSRLQTEIDRWNTANVLRTIETDLLTAYMNALYARESVAIYEEAAKVSYAQAERARQLMEAGRASRVDYAQLLSQYEQDNYSLVNAQSTYNTRCVELKRLLELGIDDELTPTQVEWTRAMVMDSLPDIAESYSMALATDVRLKALEQESKGADIDVAIAKAGRAPSITLNAGAGTGYYAPGKGFGTQMKEGWNESVGLTLAIPLLDGRKTKTAVAKARIQKLNARLDYEAREQELAQAVETWYTDVRSAQQRYVAGEEQVKSTALSAELVDEQFRLGLVNPLDLMTAHNNLLEARHQLLQAKYMAILGQRMVQYYRTGEVTL